jgi:shikimate dehydrogenase
MITGLTRVCAVWGWPVKHSASPVMHNAAFAAIGFDGVYVPMAVAPENISEAISGVRALGILGINITVPLKERVPSHLDALTDRARRLRAVNTLFWKDNQLWGDSTDGPGFLAALTHAGFQITPKTHAVVLGAGGSARAVVDALAQAGSRVTVANRTLERAETLQALGASATIALTEEALRVALSNAQLLVNTTSVGMFPDSEAMPPVPKDALHPDLFVSDLIYNPSETKLITLARSCGCRTQNGLEMLVRQGALSFEYWTGQSAPIEIMRAAILAKS